MTPPLQPGMQSPSSTPQPPRNKQSRTETLAIDINHGLHVVDCHKIIKFNYNTLSLNTILPSLKRDIATNLQAGCIKAFKNNWAILTQDPWVLQTVQGYQLPLVAQPVQSFVPPQMQFPLNQQVVISSEVESMLEKQAASDNSCATQQGEFISQIFMVSQMDWGYCPVINLKALNLFVVNTSRYRASIW